MIQFNTKMTQIANIALLFLTSPSLFRFKPSSSSSSLSFSFLSKSKTLRKPLSPLTVFSYSSSSSSSKREERRFQPPPLSRGKSSSSSTSSREDKMSKEKKLDSSMEEIPGFNKRRAEGRDKNDKPKNLQLKVRKLNPVNTISYVQILGTGLDTQDTSPSVLLFFDKQRFIFNAGEGLQRFCTEHKIKLSKIDHIFLTRVCSETAGGIPGLLLTLAGLGDEGMSVNMSGPSDLNYLVDAMRSFIPSAAMVHTNSFKHAPNVDRAEPILLIDDEVVKISAFLLQPNSFEGSQIIKGDTSPSSQGKRNPQSENPNGKDGRVLKPGDISVIYVCELPEIKGKFDPAKAVALGLKPGPKYRQLQLGHSVQSDSQNVEIHPSDVLGPSIPGPIVLLVDCPTLSHLQELPSKSLSIYYEATKDDPPDVVKKSVSCIIHLSPSSVAMTDGYQSWMKRFGKAQHIMAGHEIKNIEVPILKASARVAARLNYLCPQFFPAPGFWSLQHLSNIGPESTTSSEVSFPKLSGSIAAENLLKFHLRPYSQLGLDRSVIPSLSSPTEVVNELLTEIPEIIDAAEQVSHLRNCSRDTKKIIVPLQEDNIMTEEPWINGSGSIPDMSLSKEGLHASREEILSVDTVNVDQVNHESAHPSCLENITREDMEIVLLGTGSSQPSKYRNVSSIYVNLFSKGSLLLDCGEGTLGQLKRRFGVVGADDAVRGLRCIWISHIHADHHTGLARILALRSKLLRGVPHDPLLVVGPRQLKRFLDAYQRLEDLDMQFLDCRHTTMDALKSNEKSSSVSPVNGSLFIKDTPMQSILKRPGSPVDTSAVSHILRNLKRVLGEAGLKALISVPVVHCPQAFGLILEAAERINSVGKTIPGWKLAYSGDTRPCPELIDAACGATVLIHEATFEDSMVDEAIARNHSTTKEAIEVGELAGAYRTILTHFSQRYPKIPVFDETHMHSTCIGFDMMSINIADLPVLPKVLPYLKLLFKNEMIVEESDDVEESEDVEDSSILQPEI